MKRNKRRKSKSNGRRQQQVQNKHKRTYKDELFRMIFGGEDRRSARWRLDLYNALSGRKHTNPEDLEITTLEDVIYIGMKNDISFLVDSQMTLIEHQSSYNPNMPLRGLMYFSQLYQLYITNHEQDLYGTTLVKLPAPRYVVFYNGDKQLEETSYLKLSDAFIDFEEQGKFEWTATVKNINADYNLTLQKSCQALHDYVKYIDRIKANLKKQIHKDEAIEEALDWAISNNFLEGFFKEQRAKVLAVSLTEFDQDLYDKCRRREGFEEGAQQKALEAAENFLREGDSPEKVARCIGLPLEKVLELQKALVVKVPEN